MLWQGALLSWARHGGRLLTLLVPVLAAGLALCAKFNVRSLDNSRLRPPLTPACHCRAYDGSVLVSNADSATPVRPTALTLVLGSSRGSTCKYQHYWQIWSSMMGNGWSQSRLTPLDTTDTLRIPNCRASLSSAASMCSLLGTVSVFISFICWDPTDLSYFRVFSVLVALASCASFWIGIGLIKYGCVAAVSATQE